MIISRPVARAVSRSVARAVSRPLVRPPSAPFTPLQLFASGEQGAWYDPSDMATMFQDEFGQTPVTASGQPVGLILDKRLGLIPGLEQAPAFTLPFAASGDLNYWYQNVNPTTFEISGGALRFNSTPSTSAAQKRGFIAGKFYQVIVVIASVTGGAVGVVTGGATITLPAAPGTYKCMFVAGSEFINIRAIGVTTAVVSSVSIKELAGNHAAQTSSGAKPLYVAGSGLSWLALDGVDDFLVAPNIDLTGTGKVSVFAAARKTSDAASAIMFEFGPVTESTIGTFGMLAPAVSGATKFDFRVRASTGSVSCQTSDVAWSAPVAVIATTQADVALLTSSLRLNGLAIAVATLSGALANFSSQQLFIGRRNGASLPFNGNMYGLIIRGALTSPSDVSRVEKYMGTKTGVVIA